MIFKRIMWLLIIATSAITPGCRDQDTRQNMLIISKVNLGEPQGWEPGVWYEYVNSGWSVARDQNPRQNRSYGRYRCYDGDMHWTIYERYKETIPEPINEGGARITRDADGTYVIAPDEGCSSVLIWVDDYGKQRVKGFCDNERRYK